MCPPRADTLFYYKTGRYLNNLFKNKHIIKTITTFANPLSETLDRSSMKHILFLAIALLSLTGCMKEKPTALRWATFNIRYDNPQDSLNNWQYRKARVCKFIQEQKIDILGMQEVLHNQFLDLRSGLPEYDGIGVGRDDGKTAGEYAPLFYRKDKYEVLDSNTFWLAENPDSVGMMNIKTANQTILEASLLPTPRALWDSFWYEGELSCLFADSNVGKSILAVQIADRIARTEKQFQLRYTNEHGELYTFPDKLYRVSIDCNQLLDANFEEAIIGGIEQMAVQTDCKIFIIDNLTYLCCAMEKGDAAGRLMIQLNNLKKRYALSILVLAHTPKRSLDCPITSNDLAGSKRLYNFFDSVFVIGKSALDGGLRYVKQLKVRYGTFSYDADNVIVYEIEKTDAFLQFVFRGYSTEKEHLKKPGDNESGQRDCLILQLSQSGKSVREIASQVNCGKSTVSRIIQRSKEDRNAAVPGVPLSRPKENGTMGQVGQHGTSGTAGEARQAELFAGHEKEDKP